MEFMTGLWNIIEEISSMEIPIEVLDIKVTPWQFITLGLLMYILIKLVKAMYGYINENTEVR